MFKLGDKVFDAQYGWGIVVKTDVNGDFPIGVGFIESVESYTLDGRYHFDDNCPVLSFTEYNFVNGGFSQERSKEEMIGKLVVVLDDYEYEGFLGVLDRVTPLGYFEVNGLEFKNVELYEQN